MRAGTSAAEAPRAGRDPEDWAADVRADDVRADDVRAAEVRAGVARAAEEPAREEPRGVLVVADRLAGVLVRGAMRATYRAGPISTGSNIRHTGRWIAAAAERRRLRRR